MADDGSKQRSEIWPLPQLLFLVKWDGAVFYFGEMTGLDPELQSAQYRTGDNRVIRPAKIPGIANLENVTLKRGFFNGSKQAWDKFRDLKTNMQGRSDIAISLLNESKVAITTWTLSNACAVKIVTADVAGGEQEIVIETMELTHEGIKNRT